MTAAVAATLLVLALLDGAFAGFRASAGRTGLIDHRRSDRRAARRGVALLGVLLAPAIAVVSADAVTRPAHLADDTRAGAAMLAVYGPYALLVLIALACYTTLAWSLKYLASALILGPFTLLRPAVALLGAVAGVLAGRGATVTTAVGLSVVAVLAVEPLAGRIWYARRTAGTPATDREPDVLDAARSGGRHR